MPNSLRVDPTRTGLLRRKFLSDINKRLAVIIEEIRKLLVDDDAFGLSLPERKPLVLQAAYQQFAFTTDAKKLQAFQKWLEDQVNAGILLVSGAGTPGQPWTYDYVESAYTKGVMRAYIDSKKTPAGKSSDFYAGSREEFLRSSFAQPITLAKVELLGTRTYEQLKGFTALMGQQLNYVMSIGLASGWGPIKVAREMKKAIGNISRTKARMIARTEIVYAHAEGQLDSFQSLGIDKLGLLAEWSTAGDDLVCPRCLAKEGNTYTVDEARGLLPLHPNCRCVWIPSEYSYK